MDRDMLLLAERLVTAIETISQDVKNMSAYVYDLSCSVSHLLNDKIEKECISVVADDEGSSPASVTLAAGRKASAERQYSRQNKQANKRSSLHIADQEQRESRFGAPASMCVDPHEIADVQSSENNPIFTGEIKIEERSDDDVIPELGDIHDQYGYGRNVDEESIPHMITPEVQYGFQETESADDVSVAQMGVNREKKPHKCSMCGKSFSVHSKLLRHTRVHTGERPYKCSVCGKAFRQKIHLTLHMRSHTGERPHKCTVCGRSFSQSTTLVLHMRIHTGEKPYKCTLCEREFRHRSSLTQHMHVHAAEQELQ